MERFKDAKYVLVVGIGGSDLAIKALWSAISLHQKVAQRAFFFEAPSEREYAELEVLVREKKSKLTDFCIVVVSKSGETKETLATFDKVWEIFFDKFGALVSERVVAVTTKGSSLSINIQNKNIEELPWEGEVGGRFSAFTRPHLLVAEILGLDTKGFLAGKEAANAEKAKELALNIFESYKRGFNILDFFIFNSELEDLGKWCRQLVAESLALLTPTVSIGPTDLHSMLELYLGGPKVRFTVFLRSLAEIDDTINETTYNQVTVSYTKEGLPYMTYEIEKIDEKAVGEFMQFMMTTTVELAKLLGVDPFDQPAVEHYKSEISHPPTPPLP